MNTAAAPGSQTECRGVARPVRIMLRGWTSPAAYSCSVEEFFTSQALLLVHLLGRRNQLPLLLLRLDSEQRCRFSSEAGQPLIFRRVLVHPVGRLVVPAPGFVVVAESGVRHRQEKPVTRFSGRIVLF